MYPNQPQYGQPQYGAAPAAYPQQAPAQPAPPPGFATTPTAGGDRVKAGDLEGHLLIVVPTELLPGFFKGKTEAKVVNGVPTMVTEPDSDAVRIDVVDLDSADPQTGRRGRVYLGVLWGGAKIKPQLERALKENAPGQPMLSRMVKAAAAPGANAPFELVDQADPQSVGIATEFLTRRPDWRTPVVQASPVVQPQQYAQQPAPVQYTPPAAVHQAMPAGPMPGMSYPAPPYVQPQQYAPQQPVMGQPAPQQWQQPAAQPAPAMVMPAPGQPFNPSAIDPAVFASLSPEAQAQIMAAQQQMGQPQH